jgi:hypothetical protein
VVLEGDNFSVSVLAGGSIRSAKSMLRFRRRSPGWVYEFHGQAEFVSLGYPWVLPGHEGELQEELYDAVYGFAASPEYGGRTFAQRFREQWSNQVSFFERHGFVVQRMDPIYVLDLRAVTASQIQPRCQVACPAQFCWDDSNELSSGRIPAEHLSCGSNTSRPSISTSQ